MFRRLRPTLVSILIKIQTSHYGKKLSLLNNSKTILSSIIITLIDEVFYRLLLRKFDAFKYLIGIENITK